MKRLLAVVVLAGTAMGQNVLPVTSSENSQPLAWSSSPSTPKEGRLLGDLPPAPAGKASLIGGTIRTLDPISDRIVIQAFGGGKNAVLFDERTRVYLDGRQASLRDLSQGQHVYAETVLDKADVFARTIHIATRNSSEESNGQVVNYESGTKQLILRDALFPKPVKLRLDNDTQVRVGDRVITAAELQPGTLVNVHFTISSGQEPVARQISILAQPGTDFVFPGRVAYLDLHTNLLVVADSRDNKNYELYCDPAVVPVELREGASVTVSARFDGSHYAATAININPTPAQSEPAQ